MYHLPQEIEVWYIIPAIRRELSKELVKTHGMTLEMAGGLIGVSKAAVSQYISKKRGKSIKLTKKLLDEVKISANNINEKKSTAFHEIMRLLKLCKSEGIACQACMKHNKGVLEYCKNKHHVYDQSYGLEVK